AAPYCGPGIWVGAWVGVSIAASVAPARSGRAHAGPGRRRLDRQRRRDAAQGPVGVRAAAGDRGRWASAGEWAGSLVWTPPGGVAQVNAAHPELGPELRRLAQAILDGIDPAVRLAAARAAGGGVGTGKCQQVWCPVCALAALATGDQHPLLTVVAEHSV